MAAQWIGVRISSPFFFIADAFFMSPNYLGVFLDKAL